MRPEPIYDEATTMNAVWVRTVTNLIANGARVKPRGQDTIELLHQSVHVSMRHCVVTIPRRKLNYQFMAAEAHWILSGDDRVETIAPFNPNIAQFSDDGKIFFGAYGPRIHAQLDYVVKTLKNDRDSRQACMTLWRPNPPHTKDVPCTVAIHAMIRDRELNVHIYMRSSDVWLGLPYDIFTFSMLGNLICERLNDGAQFPDVVYPGSVFLTAGSQHLYHRDLEKARAVVETAVEVVSSNPLLFVPSHHGDVLRLLEALRRSKPGDTSRWWEVRS